MESLLETGITEADILLFMEAFCCSRDYAIHLLEMEQKSKLEYTHYLESPFDPRD